MPFPPLSVCTIAYSDTNNEQTNCLIYCIPIELLANTNGKFINILKWKKTVSNNSFVKAFEIQLLSTYMTYKVPFRIV